MVNNFKLKILNKLAFGADIDSLESYLVNMKQASEFCDMTLWRNTYIKLYEIMEEMKPESKLFEDSTTPVKLPTDAKTPYFKTYGNSRIKVCYGVDDTGMDGMKASINSNNEHTGDIIAIENISGLDIELVYGFGELRKAYIITQKNQSKDITDIVKNAVPNYISSFDDINSVEVFGKVTIENTFSRLQKRFKHVECSVNHLIRLGIEHEAISVYCTDFHFNNEFEEYDTQWSKLQKLIEVGFNVPKYYLVRDITANDMSVTLLELAKKAEETDEERKYLFNGLLIKLNSDVNEKDNKEKFIYNYKNSSPDTVYQSIVKSISINAESDDMAIVLNIVETYCNDMLSVDEVIVEDVLDIDRASAFVGNSIQFKVEDYGAVLV